VILLVEDEAIIALAEKKILEKYAYRVVWANSGEKAVEIIEAQSDIALVLMDINLGTGMDGTQAAVRILEKRDVPLIFLSSHTERDVVEKTEGISSYGYIVKNSGETVLIASIKMAFRLFYARMNEKTKDKALRAYEERLLISDKLFTHSLDMLCVAGFDGYFKVLNPSWERTLGWSIEELLSKPWLEFVHPEDRASTGSIRTVLVDGKPVHQFENRYICKNGDIKWLSWNSFPYPEENSMFGVARDVSDQRRIAEALAESEATYKALFEKSPMGIAYHQMIYDQDGRPRNYRIIAANERFKELTGVDATGMLVTDAFPGIEKDPFNWIGLYGEVAKNGKELRFQQHFKANNRWYDCAAYQYKPDHFVVAFLEISEQKKAELALHAEKERLAITLQSIGDAVIATDTEGQVEVLNGVAERLTGWTQERAKGKPLHEVFQIVNARSREPCDNPVARVLKDGEIVGLANHTMLLSADGREYQIADSAAPIRDAEGTIIGVVLVFRDVSGEYEAAQALQESETRFRTLHNASFGGIAIHEKGTILECNLGLSEMTGYEVQELIGMNGLLLIAEKSRDYVMSRIASGYELPYEALGLRKDGEEFPMRLEARNVPYKGRMVRTVEFRDMSEEKKREDQLRSTIHYLQSILQTTQDGFFFLGAQGQFQDVNDSYCAMSGYAREELLGMHINELDAEERPEDTAARIERIMAVGSETFSTRHRRKDGSILDVEMSVSFLEEGAGSFVCFCRDVSERKRAENRICTLLKDKELLLKESHHRIKNNMGLIYSLLSLQASAQSDDGNRAILSEAAGRVQSMLVLYDRLYRSEKFYELSIQAFLPALVNEIVAMAATIHSVSVELHVDDFALNSKVLSTLGIIVNELITNSIKYAFTGKDDARIRVSASKSDGIVTLIYADNGVGLPQDAAEQPSGGFGLQLIEMMAQQLDASLEIDGSHGMSYTLVFKA
jgi:PAS domain S-box-containing protein